MDDWSDSDVQEVLDNVATPSSNGRMSQDLFSSKLSQSSDFENIPSSNSKTSPIKTSKSTSQDGFSTDMVDADLFGSGANTDWLCTPQRSGRSRSQKGGKEKRQLDAGRESVTWSQDFPEEAVSSHPHQSMDTISPDKTQHPAGLPNFSFLNNNSADSAFDSPASTESSMAMKRSNSIAKRLGSRFSYPKGKSASSVASSDSQLVLDLDVIKPSAHTSKRKGGASQPKRASPRVPKRESSVSDASMVVDVNLFKTDLYADSMNDETMMTSLNTASDATHFEVNQRASGRLKMGGESQSLGSMDISAKDKSLQMADRVSDNTVPASFDTASLELSPSFRALAEELDDPRERPSETQLLQIERELDQLADGNLPELSGWSSMPDIPTQKAKHDKGSNSQQEAAGMVEETAGVVYGTMADSPPAVNSDAHRDQHSAHQHSMLRRSPRVNRKSFCNNSGGNGNSSKAKNSSNVAPEMCDDVTVPLTTSRNSASDRKVSRMQSTPSPVKKPIQFTLSNRKAARPRSPGNTDTSTSASDSQTGLSSNALVSSASVSTASPLNQSAPASKAKALKPASGKSLNASVDLTASDEDELAGVVTRRVVSPDVDLTKNDSELDDCSVLEDVPSGSEECSSVALENHPAVLPVPANSPKSATKKVARKRRIIESDEEYDIDTSGSNCITGNSKANQHSVPSAELGKTESKKDFKSTRNQPTSTKTPVGRPVDRQFAITSSSGGSLKRKRSRLKSPAAKALDSLEQLVDGSHVDCRAASLSPVKTPTTRSQSRGRHHMKRPDPRSCGVRASASTKSDIGSLNSAKALKRSKTEHNSSTSGIVSPNRTKLSECGSKKHAKTGERKPAQSRDQQSETLNSTISSSVDSPRRSRRISQKNLNKELSTICLDSAVTPSSQQQELTKLVDSILDSPLKELTTNVPVKTKDKSKRRHSQFSHERLVIEDVTLPDSESNSTEQVRSLLEFLEDTASALPLPSTPGQPLAVCNVSNDRVETGGTSLISPSSKRRLKKKQSGEVKAEVVQPNENNCVQATDINKSKPSRTRSKRRAVEEVCAFKARNRETSGLNEAIESSKSVVSDSSNQKTMLNQSNCPELTTKSPKTRSNSRKRSLAKKQPVAPSEAADELVGESVRSVIEDLESMFESSLVGEPSVSFASRSFVEVETKDTTEQSEAVAMPTKSSEISESSNSSKKNKSAKKKNVSKTCKPAQDAEESTKGHEEAEVGSTSVNATTSNQLAVTDHVVASSKSRKLQKSEPIWLTKYTVNRDKSRLNSVQADPPSAPTKAEAVCSLFTKNYGRRRSSKDSPASSSKLDTSSGGSVLSAKPADLSVFDFIPSQPSPVKKKKKPPQRRQPSKAPAEKKQANFKSSLKSPKVELIQKQALLKQVNEDWGIGSRCKENNVDEGSDFEPPMSQATALRNHINDIDENIKLTVEKQTKKRCRFKTHDSKQLKEEGEKHNGAGASNTKASLPNSLPSQPHQSMSNDGESISDDKSPHDANHRMKSVNENTSVVGTKPNMEAFASSTGDDKALVSNVAPSEVKPENKNDTASPSTILVKTKVVKVEPALANDSKPLSRKRTNSWNSVAGQSELATTKNNQIIKISALNNEDTVRKSKRAKSKHRSPASKPSDSDSKPLRTASKKSTRGDKSCPGVGLIQYDIRRYASPSNSTDVKPLSGKESQQTNQTLSPIIKSKRRSTARSIIDDTCSQVSGSGRRAVDSSDSLQESLSPVLRSRRRLKGTVVPSDSDTSMANSTQSTVRSQLSKQPRKMGPNKKSGDKGVEADISSKEKAREPTIKEFGRPTRNTQVGEKLVFTHTALTSAQKKTAENCAKILDAQIVSQYTSEVTHLITSIDSNLSCPRTMKYMLAVLEGKWVVSCEWAKFCLEHGSRISEDIFEVKGSSVAPDSSASKHSRLAHLQELPRLLDGCEFHLLGEFTPPSPPKDQLSKLIHVAGAKVLSRHPREGSHVGAYHAPQGSVLSKCGTVVLAANVNNLKRTPAITYVTPTWLMDCIAHYKLCDPTTKGSYH